MRTLLWHWRREEVEVVAEGLAQAVSYTTFKLLASELERPKVQGELDVRCIPPNPFLASVNPEARVSGVVASIPEGRHHRRHQTQGQCIRRGVLTAAGVGPFSL